MSEKIIKVFFDQSGLPFKDKELTTHFPIVGSGFLGASNTTKIRFYYKNIGLFGDTYLAISKMPNGKQGSHLLNIKSRDDDGNYVELSLSEWYFQAKGDVYISLKVYWGGVEISDETDPETGFVVISGEQVKFVTGAIKMSVNYAPIGDVPDYRDEFTTYETILELVRGKLDINESIYATSDISLLDMSLFEENQIFFDYTRKVFYKNVSGTAETIVDLSDYATKSELTSGLATKQNTLVNKSNIKALVVNGEEESLLGDGTIVIPSGSGGSAEWGSIGGDIGDQTDLQNELQDIREVAEGKCETYVLSYQTTISSLKTAISNGTKVYSNGIDISQDILDGDYDSETLLNGSFNSQNASISLSGQEQYIAIESGYHRVDLYNIDSGDDLEADFHTGDIFLVIETDVPDRWYDPNDYQNLFKKLETSKVDLDNYATKTEVNAKSDLTNIAPAYDEHTTYSVGEVVINPSGKLVKANTNISTPETYDTTHWDIVSVASDFVNLTGTQVISGEKTIKNKFSLQSSNSTYTINFEENDNGSMYIYESSISNPTIVAGGGRVATIKLVPFATNTHDLGDSTYNWRNLYLSGIINPNASGYGLILPSTASLTVNSELVDTASAQNIDAVKTFENSRAIKFGTSNGGQIFNYPAGNILLAIRDTGGGGVFFDVYAGYIAFGKTLRPQSDNSLDIGHKTRRLKDVYIIGGLRDGKNDNYKLLLPDTTSWAASKEIATTDYFWQYATNSTTQLEYSYINNISISADTTFTLATAPANTYPEYKANITNTDTANAITITLPSGTKTLNILTNTIGTNTISIGAGETIELIIQNSRAKYINWGA